MRAQRPSPRVGFTLVELLVVIAIIAILAAFLLPAIYRARISALNAQITVEIKNLERGLEAYKEKFGDYPPDFTDRDIVNRHINTAWPNIDPIEFRRVTQVFWEVPRARPGAPLYHASKLDPAEALVFWSGGFSSDPKRPFTGDGGPFLTDATGNIIGANPDRLPGKNELDKARLNASDDGDLYPVLAPPNRKVPYAYFDARTYGRGKYIAQLAGTPAPQQGVAKPYLSNRVSPSGYLTPPPDSKRHEWINKSTFQIISAGMDDNYGADPFVTDPPAFPVFPDGTFYQSPGDGDDDNVTNFSGGSLKDKKP